MMQNSLYSRDPYESFQKQSTFLNPGLRPAITKQKNKNPSGAGTGDKGIIFWMRHKNQDPVLLWLLKMPWQSF